MAYSLVWEQTETGEEEVLKGGSVTRAGELFTGSHVTIGTIPNKIIFNLRKTGDPTGTSVLQLIASDDTLKATFTPTIVPNDLTTTFVATEFINDSNTEPIVDGDRIVFTYTGDPYLRLQVCASCAETGTKQTYYSGSWTNRIVEVCTMKIYTLGGVSTGARLPPPPIMVIF